MATKLKIQEIIEFPIDGCRYGTWRYVHRYVEELRDYYRARYGRKRYRVKVESRHTADHRVARIVVMAS